MNIQEQVLAILASVDWPINSKTASFLSITNLEPRQVKRAVQSLRKKGFKIVNKPLAPYLKQTGYFLEPLEYGTENAKIVSHVLKYHKGLLTVEGFEKENLFKQPEKPYFGIEIEKVGNVYHGVVPSAVVVTVALVATSLIVLLSLLVEYLFKG